MKKAVIATIVFLLILASPVIVNATGGKLFSPEQKPDLASGTDSNAKQCVEPLGGTREETKNYMRINHQLLLKDERTSVVRQDVITQRFQVERCFSCHEYKDFCQKCHDYNDVQPTCFDKTGGCHSTEKDVFPRPEGF